MVSICGCACACLLAAVGTAAIATFGYKGAKDAKLPITVGPLTSGKTHGWWQACSGHGMQRASTTAVQLRCAMLAAQHVVQQQGFLKHWNLGLAADEHHACRTLHSAGCDPVGLVIMAVLLTLCLCVCHAIQARTARVDPPVTSCECPQLQHVWSWLALAVFKSNGVVTSQM